MPLPAPTAAQLLAQSGLSAAEARMLLAHVLRVPRERLIAFPEIEVDASCRDRFDALAQRRRAGEPMAYLVGAREFYGRRFAVDGAVLIPRPETETLIEAVLHWINGMQAPRILDLGTGSGCIAITLALERPDAQVVAVDRSPAALDLAQANAIRLGASIEWVESDWAEHVAGSFDAIVSNPPYIAAADEHLDALRYEPTGALASGADGLDALRHIVGRAPALLHPNGVLAVEHGHDQGAAVRALFAAAGFMAIETQRDLAGHERICLGRQDTGRT